MNSAHYEITELSSPNIHNEPIMWGVYLVQDAGIPGVLPDVTLVCQTAEREMAERIAILLGSANSVWVLKPDSDASTRLRIEGIQAKRTMGGWSLWSGEALACESGWQYSLDGRRIFPSVTSAIAEAHRLIQADDQAEAAQ